MKTFIAHIAQHINPFNNFHKETAMKNLIRKAAAGMAVFTLSTTAIAQDEAPAPAEVEAPAPAKASTSGSPLAFRTMKEGLNSYPYYVNHAAKIGLEWAVTVDETLTTSGTKIMNAVQRKAAAAILVNVPSGATTNFQHIGEKPMDDKVFVAWVNSKGCRFVSHDKELDLETWTPECDTLAEEISGKVKAAIAMSKASDVAKSNAEFTREKAMDFTAGDDKIALLHLAALTAVPFSQLPQAYGLKDDLNVLVGKEACFTPDGEEARCGAVESADADGVTIDGETVPWEDIYSEKGPGLHFGDIEAVKRNWGKGSAKSVANLSTCEDASKYEGLEACFYAKGTTKGVCGVVSDSDDKGVKFGETHVSCSDLMSGIVLAAAEGSGSSTNKIGSHTLGLEFNWMAINHSDLTTAHTLMMGANYELEFGDSGFGAVLGAGILTTLKGGGIADHYNRETGIRTQLYATLGFSYRAMLSESVGLHLMPRVALGTKNAVALLGTVGLPIYFGQLVIRPQVTIGRVDLNQSLGTNTVLPFEDVPVSGFTYGAGVFAGLNF